MNNSKDERIARQIWSDILQRSIKPFTWGFDFGSVRTIVNGTSFRVNSFIVGLVKIQLEDNNTYKLGIKPENFGSELTYDSVASDNLISTIDRIVRQGIFTDNRDSTISGVA